MSSLYQQRIRLLATEMYKLYYKQGPTYLHSLITRKGYTVARNGKAVEQPLCKTSRYGLNSIRYQGAKLWNSLGENFKDAVMLNNFKNLIRVYEELVVGACPAGVLLGFKSRNRAGQSMTSIPS